MDMHKLAERVELEELKKMGLLQGEVAQMMEVCVYLLTVCYMCVRMCMCACVYVCACVHVCTCVCTRCQWYLLPDS